MVMMNALDGLLGSYQMILHEAVDSFELEEYERLADLLPQALAELKEMRQKEQGKHKFTHEKFRACVAHLIEIDNKYAEKNRESLKRTHETYAHANYNAFLDSEFRVRNEVRRSRLLELNYFCMAYGDMLMADNPSYHNFFNYLSKELERGNTGVVSDVLGMAAFLMEEVPFGEMGLNEIPQRENDE